MGDKVPMQDFEVKIGGGLIIEVGVSTRHYGTRGMSQYPDYRCTIIKGNVSNSIQRQIVIRHRSVSFSII